MLLAMSTWPEVEARLARSRTIVVPIGSIEQHGPTGLLATDALCPQIIAEHAHEAGDLLVAPTFAVGMAQHHLAFPGTITLRPSTLIAAVADWTASLARHGFDRIYWLNGHGGNVATVQAAFAQIYAEASLQNRSPEVALKLRNWWELPGVLKLCTKLFPQGHGGHATPSEIAVTQFAYPGSIKRADYAPRVAGSGAVRDALDFRARHPDGRMGSDPALATPEAGGRDRAPGGRGLDPRRRRLRGRVLARPRGCRPAAMTVRELFSTPLYTASLADEPGFGRRNADLEAACLMLAREDGAGRAWCRAHGYAGYTSYASLDDLPTRATPFADLKRRLDRHVAVFAQACAFELGPKGQLKLDSLWVNVLKPGAAHSGHVHPHSVVSGTVYVATPPGSGGLRLEDPRAPLMMAAPPRQADAPEARRTFVTVRPVAGDVCLWESWLRHEVTRNAGRSQRISVSFNYAWR